jgi:hypothetical protein
MLGDHRIGLTVMCTDVNPARRRASFKLRRHEHACNSEPTEGGCALDQSAAHNTVNRCKFRGAEVHNKSTMVIHKKAR